MKKIPIFILMILMMLGVSFGATYNFVTTPKYFYPLNTEYTSGSTTIDYQGLFNGSIVGSVNVTSTLYQIGNSNSGVYINSTSPKFSATNRTIGFFVTKGSTSTQAIAYSDGNSTSGNPFFYIGFNSNNSINVFARDNTPTTILDIYSNAIVGGAGETCVVFEQYTNGSYILFINGVQDKSGSFTFSTTGLNKSAIGGLVRNNGIIESSLTGNLSLFGIWNSTLSTTAVSNFCSKAFTRSMTYSNINLTNNTYTNQTNLGIGINITTSGTNNNINTTMFLSNGSSYQIATNTANVSTSFQFQQGVYNIWFFSKNNETNVTSGNYTYTFDNTSVVITNNLASEITQYTVNLSNNISVSDINPIAYCYFNVSNGQSALCNSTSFTFNVSGNLTYTIEAKDIAGNINFALGSIYVNPYQYLRFNDSVRNVLISNYNLNNTLFTISGTYAYAKLYDIGLTNTDLLFYAFGYNNYSFTLTTTSTSAINTTYNVTPVNLTLQVFDEEVPSRQLTFNVTIFNSTTAVSYTNQLNFSKFYNETPTGEITLIITSSDYNQTYCERRLYTDLTPSAAISLTAYLLPNTSCYPVVFTILDIRQTQGISSAIITFTRLINATTYQVGQAKTDSTGKTYFNLDPDLDYTVTITKEGYVTSTIHTIPNTLSYTLTLPLVQTGSVNPFYNVVMLTRPAVSQSNIPLLVYGYTLDSDNLLTATYFTVTTAEGVVLYSNSSISSSGANLSYNITSNSSFYTLNLTILRNGSYNSIFSTITYVNSSNFGNVTIIDLGNSLDGVSNTGDRVFIMLIIVAIFIILGSFISGIVGGGGSVAIITGMLPFFYFGSVEWLSWPVAILFIVISGILALYIERVF